LAKRLVITATALEDLREIRRYIAQEDPYAAQMFVADIAAKIEWIADVEFKGLPRDNIAPGLCALPYRKRCIYFRSFNDRIVVVRVLHGAQDVGRQSFGE